MKPLDLLELTYGLKGSELFVVMNAEGTNLLYNPALRQPFHTKNRKFADVTAQSCGGVVMTAKEAMERLHTILNRELRESNLPELASLPELLRRHIENTAQRN